MLISNDFSRLVDLKLKAGSVFVFWTRVHCVVKCWLDSSARNMSLPSAWKGGIFGIFFLLKNLFIIDQHVFVTVSG